jgi:hypothetical protein
MTTDYKPHIDPLQESIDAVTRLSAVSIWQSLRAHEARLAALEAVAEAARTVIDECSPSSLAELEVCVARLAEAERG